MVSTHHVVDASVALKWVLPETGSDKAEDLLVDSLHAPDFWRLECANALSRLYRRKFITSSDVRKLMADLESIDVTDYGYDTLLSAALTLSVDLSHDVYDCLYLALALREDIPLITADKKFYTAVTKHSPLKKYIKLL